MSDPDMARDIAARITYQGIDLASGRDRTVTLLWFKEEPMPKPMPVIEAKLEVVTQASRDKTYLTFTVNGQHGVPLFIEGQTIMLASASELDAWIRERTGAREEVVAAALAVRRTWLDTEPGERSIIGPRHLALFEALDAIEPIRPAPWREPQYVPPKGETLTPAPSEARVVDGQYIVVGDGHWDLDPGDLLLVADGRLFVAVGEDI